MGFSLEEDYLLGALVVLLLVIVVIALRESRDSRLLPLREKGSFITIPPPPGGWDAVRGGPLSGGTVPGWGAD